MPTIRFSRPFSSGSRPTPDPFDKFLDSHGFYRKHTPRDSSNLFRVISEQLYDTQDQHLRVRKDCVNFLIKHREQYEPAVKENFDQYVQKMAKTETFGTLMELRAMGYLFKRNILLYGPFDLGTLFVDEAEYVEPILRIFHATHFDSVFEKSYIMNAAFCQSVVYEMLYKNVYKLPDIEYSVETMLHSDIKHEPSKHEYGNGDQYATHIVFEDGRKFELDRPENTLCILSDPERCNFHNKDFEETVKRDSRRFEKSILSDKFNSCVRQLLFDGITPFPYKVAKALDENIYRNVEFDSWNEERKSLKQKQNNYKVGIECLVKLSETTDDLQICRIESKEDDGMYVVYVDKLAENRSVSYTSLRPLNDTLHNSFKSRDSDQYMKNKSMKGRCEKFGFSSRNVTSHIKSKLPNDSDITYDAICNTFNFEPYINLSNFNFTSNNQNEVIAYPLVYSQSTNMNPSNNTSGNTNNSSKPSKNRNQNAQNHAIIQHNSNDNQQNNQKGDNENSYGKNVNELKGSDVQTPTTYYQHQHQSQEQHGDTIVPVTLPVPNIQQHHAPNYYNQGSASVYYCATPEYNEQGVFSSEMLMQPGVYAIQNPYQTPPIQPNVYAPVSGNQAAHYPIPVNTWPAYNPPMNPQGYVLSGPPPYATVPAVPTPMPITFPFLNRDLIRSTGRINFNHNFSHNPAGDDLPINDKPSMRFFYNLGIEYFKFLNHVYGYGTVMSMMDGDNVGNAYDQPANEDGDGHSNQMVSEFQHLHLESAEGDTQSPKPRNYIESGYRRNMNVNKYKRNDRPMSTKHFQNTYNGPSKQFMKNNQKYNQNGNNSYDSTPMKDNGIKPYQHGHGSIKRDQSNNDPDGVNGFGFNVPPFPYVSDPNEHYGPPGLMYTRISPPTGNVRPSSVQNPQYHHNNHQMHSFSPNCWMSSAPPILNQPQSLSNQSQQNQSHSLNTSGASNPSQ